MNDIDKSNILTEAIEVFIYQILYIRDMYPAQVFKKRRFYNSPIFVSTLPALNNYMAQILKAMAELENKNQLHAIELIFYREENEIIETYTFRVHKNQTVDLKNDEYLLHFEEELRKSLYTLAERLNILQKLPNDAKFRIQFQTTQTAHMELSQNSNFQDFPWLDETQETESKLGQKTAFIPLLRIESLGFNVKANIFNQTK